MRGIRTKQTIQSNETKSCVKDGDTLFITDITLGGYADEVVKGIEKSSLETGHPRDLAAYWASSIRDRDTTGMAHLTHEGLPKRGVGGHLKGYGRNMINLTASNKAEIFNFPQSVTATMAGHISTEKLGVVIKIGLGMMMDPRMKGGAMNDGARNAGPQVELIDVYGEERLFYKLPRVNVTLIRGNVADERGNISIYREGYKLNQLSAASVAKTCGGVVIVRMERIVEIGSTAPKDVAVPDIIMDYIFYAKPENHWQTGKSYYNPLFSGELRAPPENVEKEMPNARKVIVRRAVMLMRRGDVRSLGAGTPETVSPVAVEEGMLDETTLTAEAGNIGDMPASKYDFGYCWNPEATIEMADNFNYYDDDCLDYGCLEILQIDTDRNINASKLSGGGIGVGGFMDVATGSKTVVFTIVFVGGVEVEIKDRKLKILKEGNIRKFLYNIEQISSDGELALKDDKQIYYVTERIVFRLMWEGLELTEIVPGIDLQRDILNQVDFEPIMRNVQMVPPKLFNKQWDGLAESMEGSHQKKKG